MGMLLEQVRHRRASFHIDARVILLPQSGWFLSHMARIRGFLRLSHLIESGQYSRQCGAAHPRTRPPPPDRS